MRTTRSHFWLSDFARQDDPGDELIIPEDLSTLDDDALEALGQQAFNAFEAIQGDDDNVPTSDELEQLETITEAIEAIRAEQTRRDDEKSERKAKADELAAKVKPAEEPTAEAEDTDEGSDDDTADESADEATDEAPDTTAEVVAEGDVDTSNVPDTPAEITEAQPEPIAASANKQKRRGSTRVNLSGIRHSQARTPRPSESATTMRDVVTAAADMPGFANGQGMDWTDIGRGINRRMRGFNASSYVQAQKAGRHMRQQFSVAGFRKPFDRDLIVTGDDPAHLDAVMDRAVDESRLPGGSLLASGGWCAPSETVYDLCNLSSRDGMLSVPEIQVSRGGIRYASSPSFADVYGDTGFCYTEQEDIDGDYDGEGGGEKPCAPVPCPDFEDYRLNLCGTCITSGLLQSRGYPEALADFTQKALIAHDHRLNARVINEIISYSTGVDWPAPQAGATAPLLSSIEFNVELIKQGERMARNTSVEGIFPYWVRGVIRADLSRRLGVDLIDVPDSRINAWFTQRGINPQFVYDWQDLASDAVAYPDTVDILLYPAGSFVKGVEDIISLDTIYDSTQLGQNNFTALFFEEGWLVAPRCGESRVVTVPICPSGSTHAGELISCDGTGTGSAS